MDKISYLYEWCKIGKNINKYLNEENCNSTYKDVFRFMMYWMNFNLIYDRNYSNGNQPNLIKKHFENNKDDEEIYKNLLSLKDVEIFKEKPVFYGNKKPDSNINYMMLEEQSNHRYKNNIENYKKLNDDLSNVHEKIKSLFLIIYQVRCNLFHGGKQIDCERDMKLVEAGANILEKYFEEKYKI